MKSKGLPPAPWGLVMAGGDSRRMGTDKAYILRADGSTWLQHAAGLLGACCDRVLISVKEPQRGCAPGGLDVITDGYAGIGPAAGLLSAWDSFPDRPWLVLATDMPLVTVALLERLLTARVASMVATGFRHADGVAEPLCTLWEPVAGELVRSAAGVGKVSLSRLMGQSEVNWVSLDDPDQLRSVNTPSERGRLEANGPRSGLG
jgi:molybdopterin-guanine dinucleotide biosynthesis protein A